MGNFTTYLNNYGNLTFDKMPINDIDYAILAKIAFINFKGVIENHEKLTLNEANFKLKNLPIDNNSDFHENVKFNVPLLNILANTERFKNIQLSNFVLKFNKETEEQFNAITFDLYKKFRCVAFGGTNDTLVGWKEDFNMAYMSPVPCQISSKNYINESCDGFKGKISVIGHSKGGNLALYSSTKANKKIQKNIERIINFDGPGLIQEDVKEMEKSKLTNKCISYIPENSVIGKLFSHKEQTKIIKSELKGLIQHDMHSWAIDDKDFVYGEKISDACEILNSKIQNALETISTSQKEMFIETLFKIVKINQFQYLDDLAKNKLKIIKTYMNMDKETKKIFHDALTQILKDIDLRKAFKELFFDTLIPNKPKRIDKTKLNKMSNTILNNNNEEIEKI